ncbi:ATP/maltotriose-dependent transcriptional regulator MalT [Krasilnikovia cinnamomea]|uniref:ATP/maltotriose-dependent transcriptional regulator MalT n=1 Tax=Krasilnikovia cinnamomea TaxID=349313 RepID=A0A4Q7ZR48_9ACTN|nr:LuxR family transcriptional regulator [Krasilnikovia cinnamomea]RZU53618.1 ATP/maltotriose-dependent transcriptional regulator MalT [Krasilnikovia cinnamomea]
MMRSGADENHECDTVAIRKTEMGVLRRALARCSPTGRWVVVEVAGEPGMGKSTLLAGFGRHAADAGWRVLPCRSGPPAAGHGNPEEGCDPADPGRESLVPRIADVLRAPVETGSRADRRLLLIVDDVHGADAVSARLIADLLRHPPRGPVLLVLAHRPRQLTGTLGAVLATAAAAGVVQRVTLGPLAPAESSALLSTMAPAPHRFDIHEASGGNPLYLLGSAGTSGAVPERVRAALMPELLARSTAERQVVWAAAVAGDPADPELVAAVADCTPAVVLQALDQISADDVLRPAPSGAGFCFRHEVVRAVAYESAPAGWRLAAHARAAEALRGRGAPASDRARHLEHCAVPGDEDAVETLSRAAREVLYRAPADAVRWLVGAARLLPSGPHTADRRADLQLQCARALGLMGRLDESRGYLHRLLAGLPTTDAVRRVEAAVLAARTDQQLGRHAEADSLLRGELQALRPPAGSAPPALYAALASGAMLRGDAAEARRWSTEALGQDVGAASRVAALALRVLADRMTGIAESAAHLDEAADLVDAMLDDELVAVLDLVRWLAEAELAAERIGDALRHTERMLAVARQARRYEPLATLHGIAGRAWLLRGDLTRALQCLDRAAGAAERTGNPATLAEVAAVRAWPALWQGDATAAARFAAQAHEQDSLVARRLVGGRATIGAWQQSGGDAAAANRLCRALDTSECDPLVRVRWLELAAVTCAQRRLSAAAAACAAAARQLAAETSGRRIRGYAALAVAHSLLGTDSTAAAGAARRAADLLAMAGDPLGAAWARQRHDAALGAPAGIGGDAGQGKAGKPASGIAALTVRETEVVTLVAEGLTNKEIARRLFVSPGTVSIHVGRAYAKLGVSRRAAAAARLVGAGLVGSRPGGEPDAPLERA